MYCTTSVCMTHLMIDCTLCNTVASIQYGWQRGRATELGPLLGSGDLNDFIMKLLYLTNYESDGSRNQRPDYLNRQFVVIKAMFLLMYVSGFTWEVLTTPITPSPYLPTHYSNNGFGVTLPSTHFQLVQSRFYTCYDTNVTCLTKAKTHASLCNIVGRCRLSSCIWVVHVIHNNHLLFHKSLISLVLYTQDINFN